MGAITLNAITEVRTVEEQDKLGEDREGYGDATTTADRISDH